MCKEGISCSYGNEQGRIENIRLNESKNNVVGDFRGNFSRYTKSININSVNFLNKKAEKKAAKLTAPLWVKITKPEEKIAV